MKKNIGKWWCSKIFCSKILFQLQLWHVSMYAQKISGNGNLFPFLRHSKTETRFCFRITLLYKPQQHPDTTPVAWKRFLWTWSPTVGSYPQQMFFIWTWATLLLLHAVSSFLSIHPAPWRLIHYPSNGHHQYPHSHLASSYGNHSISLSMQFH